ncbi:hypothetical protein [Streptomyces sp. enrichment culture]|uniref:hypothetical protein n=1 Tax=Streptomyces sp. enrichment culture TaxID=1795815 RepID=UPI003F569C30
MGSPWAREGLLDAWTSGDAGVMSMVYRALLAPGWELSPGTDDLYTRAPDLRGNVAFLTLLAGIAVLVPRLVGRAPEGRGIRLAASLGTGVLVSMISTLVSWAVVAYAEPGSAIAFGRSDDDMFILFVIDGLVLGALLGVAIRLVYIGAGASAQAAPPPVARGGDAAVTDDTPAVGHTARPVATGKEPGDATRYLCAAAYTDPAFARRVVEGVLGDRLGAIAVSPGVDLVPVARHSLTARRLHRERNRKLLAAYGLVALFGPLWLLYAWMVPGLLGGVSTSAAKYLPRRGRHVPQAAFWPLAAMALFLLAAGVLTGVVLSALPLPGVVLWLVGGYGYGIPPLLAVVVGTALALRTVLREEADIDARLRGALRRDAFDPDALPSPPPLEPWAAARITALADAQRGNVTCYSGFTPFVGFGRREAEWTLSLPLLPPEPSGRVTDFDAWDVVERLRRHLARTAGDLPAARGGAGLTVEDRVFVSGRELSADGRLLPDPLRAPATRLPDAAVREVALHPDGPVRHFLAAHLPLWGGEIVPSQFLHVAVAGGTLHLRCERYVLGPVRRDMHAVDLLPPAAVAGSRRALLPGALRRTGGALWRAPWSCLADALTERRRPRRLDSELRAAREDPAFDRGARLSIRETAQGPEYFHHFQLLDARRALNALDRHALAAVRDFLDEHGVDTTDFRAQTQTILNHGVLQTGGVSVVGNQAVGAGARATAKSAQASAGARPPSGGAAAR